MNDAPPQLTFSLKYDGPVLQTGRMGAGDAGLAIMSAGRLIERASDRVLGGSGQVSLEVDANFLTGSFDIGLTAVSWVGETLSAVSLDDLKTVVSVVFGGGGLFGLYKWLRGGQPEKIEIGEDGNSAQFTFLGERYETSVNVYNLFLDGETRDALRGLVAPVSRAGIDMLVANPPDEDPVEIMKDEVPYFDLEPEPQEVVSEHTSHPVLGIVSIVYKEDNQWRFREGEAEFHATIEDGEFWRRIHDGEPLPEGSALKVEMVARTVMKGGDMTTTRRITKVHDIIRGGQVVQLRLMDAGT